MGEECVNNKKKTEEKNQTKRTRKRNIPHVKMHDPFRLFTCPIVYRTTWCCRATALVNRRSDYSSPRTVSSSFGCVYQTMLHVAAAHVMARFNAASWMDGHLGVANYSNAKQVEPCSTE